MTDAREAAWWRLHDALEQWPGWAVTPASYHAEERPWPRWHVTAVDARRLGRRARHAAFGGSGDGDPGAGDARAAARRAIRRPARPSPHPGPTPVNVLTSSEANPEARHETLGLSVTMYSMDTDGLSSLDREFVLRTCDRCGESLDVEVSGDEIGHELGLDEQQAAETVARLARTGFLRDVGAHLRIKITIRSLALLTRDG